MVYQKLDSFPDFLKDCIDSKKDFWIEATSYTKKFVFEDEQIIFNPDGKSDTRILTLISKVRSDAANYRGETRNTHIDYSDLLQPPPKGEICKIDVKGAYWNCALMMNVIKETTNQYLLDMYENTKEMKEARLKALGSLATKKIFTFYENGLQVEQKVKTLPTKPVYMEINRNIDELMKRTNVKCDGVFFYYWDCIFVEKRFSQDVVDYIKSCGYHTTTQETRTQVVKVGNSKYLVSKSDDKVYIIPKEKEFLTTGQVKLW